MGGPFGNDTKRIQWKPAAGADGSEFYDLLRSTSPSFAGALCVETDDPMDTDASDASVPSPGQIHFYLARAGNPCGEGSLGTTSAGAVRTGASCP